MTYALSPNRQRPLAGTAHAAVFNTWRRFRGQVFYWAPPFIAAYLAMKWATERSVAFSESHLSSARPYSWSARSAAGLPCHRGRFVKKRRMRIQVGLRRGG